MKQKHMILIGVAVLLLALVGGGVWMWKMKTTKAPVATVTKTAKKRIVEEVNIIPVPERPVVFITPLTDGRNIEITVTGIKKPATSVEYEIEYFTENLVQGAQGEFPATTLPAVKKLLLGSCSAGGACSYHTNVTGDTLKTRFVGPENYALKQSWRFIENKTKSDTFSSEDGKFQLKSPALAKLGLAVISNSPGYPEGLSGSAISEVYVFKPATPVSDAVEVTLRANEEGATKLMGWNGTAWADQKAKINGKILTATGPVMQLYVATK